MKLSENLTINDDRETITAFGVEMTGELLKAFTEPTPPGEWFRIVRREGGGVTVHWSSDAEHLKPEGAVTH